MELFFDDVIVPAKSTSFVVLKKEYEKLLGLYYVKDEFIFEFDRVVQKIIFNKDSYLKIGIIPWWLVGILHYKQTNFDFTVHLHNGDSLNSRTKHSPKNRPRRGKPPFSWHESAIDAIKLKKEFFPKRNNWDKYSALYFLESFFGFQYRLKERIFSPDLWYGTSIYDMYGDIDLSKNSVISLGVAPLVVRFC